jgi:hypothetical protein
MKNTKMSAFCSRDLFTCSIWFLLHFTIQHLPVCIYDGYRLRSVCGTNLVFVCNVNLLKSRKR